MLLYDPTTVLATLALALALDWVLGDPPALYRRLPHPVVLMGRGLAQLETRWLDRLDPPSAQRAKGRRATLIVVGGSTAIGLALAAVLAPLPFGWPVLALAMSSLIATRSLRDHVAAVADGLKQSLESGRRAVGHIVGRDPASLDSPGVARAAIESTAENFADGVVAPVLWGLFFGLPGMLAYKAINTADSMIGYRSEHHHHFGRFAARLDDAANWLPARLAGLLILAAAIFMRGAAPQQGWQAMRRDATCHRSPNAGWPEAAMAGCLGLRLAGPRHYGGEVIDDAWMGDGRGAATPHDIRRALTILKGATVILATLLGAAWLIGLADA